MQRFNDDFWSAKASEYLRAYFRAAELAGLDKARVAGWVVGHSNPCYAEAILLGHGETQLAFTLSELRSRNAPKTVATVRMVMTGMLAAQDGGAR
jgi:hypothetical protein